MIWACIDTEKYIPIIGNKLWPIIISHLRHLADKNFTMYRWKEVIYSTFPRRNMLLNTLLWLAKSPQLNTMELFVALHT